ncbi:MAG: hypothetical protein EPO27_00590 [Betaproteobacteria bacterium]|nr:MAG: hypothetical protein EPO27_00590 [Betaproteobacteria bacterium]
MRLFWMLLALVTGCATVTPPPDPNVLVGKAVETTIEALRAPANEQRGYLLRAQQAHATRPDDANSLCLALLLTALPAPLRDEERAQHLLAPIAARQPETPIAKFARLLSNQLQEQKNAMKDGTETLQQEKALRAASEEREKQLLLRLEAVRAAHNRDAAQLRRQTDALRASEQREDTLKRQIDSLRASERSMIEREEKLGTKSR